MERAALVQAGGADFMLLGPNSTQLSAKRPVISITAVRTGCGKSQTTRRVTDILTKKGRKMVVIRHPMPYGNLKEQAVQRFATPQDLDRYNCTIEEREEYEPHIARGNIVYAGVDYGLILKRAEEEAEVIVWDGGNNDFPFYKPDLSVVVCDPHRLGHELSYYPGLTNLQMADVVVINKVDTADGKDIQALRKNIRKANPKAQIIEAASPMFVEDPQRIRDKRALVIEDGPTLTHGEMSYGAGTIAAFKFGASEIVDPRPFASGSIGEVYHKYPHIGKLLPAMGYGKEQIKELEETVKKADCDVVIIGTPIDLSKVIDFEVPAVRVRYELEEIGRPNLEDVLKDF
jgi:predicted GTPase